MHHFKYWLLLIFALLAFALPAFCATTTVSQQVLNPDGSLASGQALIRITAPCKSGTTYVGDKTIAVKFVGGAFTVALVPNDTCVPSGTSYTVAWLLTGGTTRTQSWVVPTSGSPVTVDAVVVSPAPNPAYVSVGLTMPSWFSVANSPVTGTSTLAVTAATGQTSHQVIGTCGSATSFAPCALVAADVPTLNQNTTGTAANVTGVVAEANGGTGANNTVGAAGHVLRSNATHYVDAALACSDLSNAAASCSSDATNATNITSGTLAAARLPTAIPDIPVLQTAMGTVLYQENFQTTSGWTTVGCTVTADTANYTVGTQGLACSPTGVGTTRNFTHPVTLNLAGAHIKLTIAVPAGSGATAFTTIQVAYINLKDQGGQLRQYQAYNPTWTPASGTYTTTFVIDDPNYTNESNYSFDTSHVVSIGYGADVTSQSNTPSVTFMDAVFFKPQNDRAEILLFADGEYVQQWAYAAYLRSESFGGYLNSQPPRLHIAWDWRNAGNSSYLSVPQIQTLDRVGHIIGMYGQGSEGNLWLNKTQAQKLQDILTDRAYAAQYQIPERPILSISGVAGLLPADELQFIGKHFNAVMGLNDFNDSQVVHSTADPNHWFISNFTNTTDLIAVTTTVNTGTGVWTMGSSQNWIRVHPVKLSTSGTLPTCTPAVAASTIYWMAMESNTGGHLYTTVTNAAAATNAISCSGAGTGTLTVTSDDSANIGQRVLAAVLDQGFFVQGTHASTTPQLNEAKFEADVFGSLVSAGVARFVSYDDLFPVSPQQSELAMVSSVGTLPLTMPDAATVTPTCSGTCASSYCYRVAAVDAFGNDTGGNAEVCTNANAATLDGSHYNTITPAVLATATSCNVYRTTTGGQSAGLVGNVACGSGLNDTGQAAGATWATVNSTGILKANGITPPQPSGFGLVAMLNGTWTAATASGFVSNSANQVYVFSWYIPTQLVVSNVGYTLTTNSAASVSDICIYNTAGSLLANTGGLNTAGSAQATTAAITQGPLTLPPGWYYFAQVSSSTAVKMTVLANAAQGPMNLGSVKNYASAANAATAGVCPATLGTLTGGAAVNPVYARFY